MSLTDQPTYSIDCTCVNSRVISVCCTIEVGVYRHCWHLLMGSCSNKVIALQSDTIIIKCNEVITTLDLLNIFLTMTLNIVLKQVPVRFTLSLHTIIRYNVDKTKTRAIHYQGLFSSSKFQAFVR